jgi:hypothetical protein
MAVKIGNDALVSGDIFLNPRHRGVLFIMDGLLSCPRFSGSRDKSGYVTEKTQDERVVL